MNRSNENIKQKQEFAKNVIQSIMERSFLRALKPARSSVRSCVPGALSTLALDSTCRCRRKQALKKLSLLWLNLNGCWCFFDKLILVFVVVGSVVNGANANQSSTCKTLFGSSSAASLQNGAPSPNAQHACAPAVAENSSSIGACSVTASTRSTSAVLSPDASTGALHSTSHSPLPNGAT